MMANYDSDALISQLNFTYTTQSHVDAVFSQVKTYNPRRIACTYDALGNVLSMTGSEGTTFYFERDEQDRVKAILNGTFTPYVEYGYQGAGTLVESRFHSGMVRNVALDGKKRPVAIDFEGATSFGGEGKTFAGFEYAYNAANVLVAEAQAQKGGRGHWYGYDEAYRLTSVYEQVSDPLNQTSAPTSYDREFEYVYDDVGNLTSRELENDTVNFAGWTFAAADELNRYSDIDLDGSTIDFDGAYDSNHNMNAIEGYDASTLGTEYLLTYDAYNRLIEMRHDAGGAAKPVTVYEAGYYPDGKLAYEINGPSITADTPLLMDHPSPLGCGTCGAGAAPTEVVEDDGSSVSLNKTICPGPTSAFVSPGGGGGGHPNPALTIQGFSPRTGNAPTEPCIMVTLDKADIDGDGSVTDYVTLELQRDRLGSVVCVSTDANQGKAGPFVVERIDYLGGYGAAAYSDILCAGYVSAVDVGGEKVTLDVFTHFEPGVSSLSSLDNSLASIEPGTDDSDYNLIDGGSWSMSNELDLKTSAVANFAVGDYIEIWSKPLKRHASTTPTESNGRTTVTLDSSWAPAATNQVKGCYLLDLTAADLRVPVVITGNDTSTITIEGTNLYTDTEFADGANYFRVYRRNSAIGNPFGFAGGWLVSGNYNISSAWRSVKQLWYFWNRHYEPEYLLRWLQPDPIGPWGDAAEHGSGFGYAAKSPSAQVDPSGLATSTNPANVGRTLKNCFIVRFFAVHRQGDWGVMGGKSLVDWFDWEKAYIRPWKATDPHQAGLTKPQDFTWISQVGVAIEPTPNDPNCKDKCAKDAQVECTFSYYNTDGDIVEKIFLLPDSGYMPGPGSNGQDIDDTHTSAHVVHHREADQQGYDTDSKSTANNAAQSAISIVCRYADAMVKTLVAVFDG